jgi:hypothetical protein
MPLDGGPMGLAAKIAMNYKDKKGQAGPGGEDDDHPGYDEETGTCEVHPQGCNTPAGGADQEQQPSAWQQPTSRQSAWGGGLGWGGCN